MVNKNFLRTAILLVVSVAMGPALADDATPPKTFDACVAGRVASSGGKLTAEAAARKACRSQFPLSADEMEALRIQLLTKPPVNINEPSAAIAKTAVTPQTSMSGSVAPATTSTTPTSGNGATAAPTPPAQIFPPFGGSSPMPGNSGNSQHGEHGH